MTTMQQVSRTLLELNALCGVGAVLDKKESWIKWAERPEIRSKWLSEIKHAFVAKSIRVLSCWPESGETSVLRDQVKRAVQVSDLAERRQLLDAACRQVRYIDDWADDEDDRERKDGQLRFLQPYGQVAWYMHEWVHIQRVRALAVETMALEDVDAVFNDVDLVAQRAADLVMALWDGELSLARVREALGSPPQEHNEDVLLALLQYIAMIRFEVNDVEGFVTETISTVLEHPSGKSFAAVQERFQSDVLIPEELKRQLLRGVTILENVPSDQQDWHPQCNNQVLDLVHPSLYCGIYGLTKRVEAVESTSGLDAATAMKRLIGRGPTGSVLENPFNDGDFDRMTKSIKFQWLPSEFEIRGDGEVRIRSYINNLHPEGNAELYQTIEQIFGRFVPLFSLCLGRLSGAAPPRLIGDYALSRLHRCELPPIRGCVQWDAELNASLEEATLTGTTVQVIVKIAEIVLTPENPTYHGGSWHIEGTPVEGIVATGIYYFSSENVTESKLAFRAQIAEPGYSQHDNLGVAATFGLYDSQALAQNVGAVTTGESRCLVFPNVPQHKVLPFELADKTKPGVRKILCFFLVDPSTKIPSTAQIAPQQREWITRVKKEHAQQPRGLSEPLAASKQEGLTREEAESYRLELMEERSPQKTTEGSYTHFSLCEH